MIIGIDTETTGLPGRDPDVRITQLAVVTPDKATSYLLRLPPDAPYSDEAAAITGLTRERLEAAVRAEHWEQATHEAAAAVARDQARAAELRELAAEARTRRLAAEREIEALDAELGGWP